MTPKTLTREDVCRFQTAFFDLWRANTTADRVKAQTALLSFMIENRELVEDTFTAALAGLDAGDGKQGHIVTCGSCGTTFDATDACDISCWCNPSNYPSTSPGAQEEREENPLWLRGVDYDVDTQPPSQGAQEERENIEVIQGEVGREFPACEPTSPVAPASELLADLNRAQNTRGIGAWVKDVIQRAYAALTRLQQEVAWRDAERNNMLNEADAKDAEIARLKDEVEWWKQEFRTAHRMWELSQEEG